MKDFSIIEPLDYLRIPWRRRWYFLAGMILVLLGTFIYARLRPNLYRSETRIFVESATLLDDSLSPSAAQFRTEQRAAAIRQLLESRTILERIIEEFRLRAMDTSMPLEDALANIRSSLEVSRVSGNSFTLAYYATDPQIARAVVSRLAEILIQTNQAAQRNEAVLKDQFLEQELRQAELDLAAIDEKIKQFKASHLGELPEQTTANMNALTGLHNQLIAVETALDRAQDQQDTLKFRIQEQRRLSTLAGSISQMDQSTLSGERGQNVSSQLASLLIAKQAQLAEAESQFTPKHPDVIRLTQEISDLEQQLQKANSTVESTGSDASALTALGSETAGEKEEGQKISPVELSAQAEIAQAEYELETISKTVARREEERESILSSIKAYQNRLNLAPALEQEMAALTREHDSKQQQVANLKTRKFNAEIAANAVSDNNNDIYRIMDAASLPERPIFPTRLHIILLGICASLVAGCAAALARELLEPSIASEAEATAILKVPVLASIPEISQGLKELRK